MGFSRIVVTVLAMLVLLAALAVEIHRQSRAAAAGATDSAVASQSR